MNTERTALSCSKRPVPRSAAVAFAAEVNPVRFGSIRVLNLSRRLVLDPNERSTIRNRGTVLRCSGRPILIVPNVTACLLRNLPEFANMRPLSHRNALIETSNRNPIGTNVDHATEIMRRLMIVELEV